MSKVKKFRLHEEDDISLSRLRKKEATLKRAREMEVGGFACSHCDGWAAINEHIGTHNRNHCPHCLWSVHVDDTKHGDRKSECKSGMEPIAVTFKGETDDKYAAPGKRLGEIMLVHQCVTDGVVRINRIAADDNPYAILEVFEQGQQLTADTLTTLSNNQISVASMALKSEIEVQLFGRV